jgi:transcription elongation factor GreA
MDNGFIYMSKEGYDKLEVQIRHLQTVRRKEISIMLQEARAHGDLSENAEYEAAKEVQGFNEMKIAELETQLARARVIDMASMPKGVALLGTTVTIVDIKTKEKIEYKLVSELEADFAEDKISVSSPVGKGLLGHKEGEKVEIQVPSGVLKYEVVKIERTI